MWPRRKAERLLDEMIRENRRQAAHLTAEQEAKRRDRRSDLTVAALGVTLGLICALFPWYIFFNPDEFGVRAMKFGGSGAGTEPILLGGQTDRIGAPVTNQNIPEVELDLTSTGTATREFTEDEEAGTLGLSEQPFPPPVVEFKLVQVANGRALLQDDTGLFVVQPGSILPDGARVAAIQERNRRPVLITDSGATLEISE